MISASRFATWAAALLLLAPSVSAEVSKTPQSPTFEAIVRPLLTPLEEAAAMDTSASEEQADSGVLVLEEEVYVVDAEARSVVALHRIIKPMTEAGVESASRLVFPYNAGFQHVSLVTAQTRAPDGQITPIGAEAAFIQTPQHDADEAIYSDSEELVVLFSNVKPGHLVEWVVVVESDEPRMPGCWGTVIRPGAYWPIARFRTRVDIEEPLASSLIIAPRGGPLPEATNPKTRPGWRAWQWVENDAPPLRQETDRAPSSQFGRAIRLTTVATWDDVARWYRDLLASRSTLSPELEAQVDEWVGDQSDPEMVLDELLRKVADDVRYTGLEFGFGALQPRTPDDIWSSQYGDCKDKSNLLRVMLASRGIDSHMVLLNTEHAGRIEPAAPHYGQFNHAILAVELPDGRVFCDPTVADLPAGVLSPSSTGRQVLLIGDRKAELVTIPSQEWGTLLLGFEIEVSPAGGLQGWLEISTAGSVSAAFSDFFTSVDTSAQRLRFQSLVNRFFEAADLIDIELPEPVEADGLTFFARGYFVVNGVHAHEADTSVLLRFPHGRMVFPDLEDEHQRETPWYQHRELTEVEIHYQLPEGWREQSALPQPLKVSSPAVTAEARWSRDDNGVMTAALSYRTEVDLVDPQEFSRLKQAVTAIRTWMDRSVAVVAGGGAPLDGDSQVAGVDMPLMPTGEGQLRLVNRSYPSDGDRELRRAALLQVRQLFPDSTETVFDVEIWLGQLDAMEGQPEQSVPRIERAIELYGDAVPRETVAWAQYSMANHLYDMGETDRAMALLGDLVKNESLTSFRRAVATELLGALLAENGDVPGAIRVLDEGIALESELHAELQDLRARILLEEGLSEDLQLSLTREMAASPHLADWTFESLVGTVGDLADEGETADAAALAGVLLAVADTSPHLTLDQQERSDLLDLSRATLAYLEIAAAIGVYLENPSSDWIRNAEATPAGSPVEMAATMSRFDDGGQVAEYVRCGLERLAVNGTAVGDFGMDLWQLAAITNANRPDDPVLDELIGWGLMLPRIDDYYLETIFIQAQQLERRGQIEEAAALLGKWTDDREISPIFRVAFKAEFGLVLEHQGLWEEALESYRSLEPDRNVSIAGYDALLRAVFINLGLGRYDEALRVIGLLAELDEELRLYCDSPSQIAEFVALAEDPDRARKFWSLQRDWMPVWLSLERSVGLDPAPELVVPVIPDIIDLASEMGRAVDAGASRTYFEDYRTFVHAARWQPEMVIEVCSLAKPTGRMAGDDEDLVQALVVALATGLDIGDESIYKRSRHVLAMYYVSHDLYPQTVALAREYFTRYEADDPLGRGLLRLWGVAASESGLDREILTERLQGQLAEYDLEGERTVTVLVLAELYRKLGLRDEEIELIKTEIIDGTIDHERFGEQLENRYAAMLDKPAGETDFTTAVELWLSTFSPPWFEAAAPASLDDALAQQIDRDIEDHPERYSQTEIIKYRLLVALDPTRPLVDRQNAFGWAVVDLEDLCVSVSKADAMVIAVLDDDRLSAFAQGFVPWMAMDTAFVRGNRMRLEWWLASDHSAGWKQSERKRIERMIEGLPLPTDETSEIENAAVLLLGDPLDDMAVRALRQFTKRLMQLGEFQKVREIIGLLADAEFDTVVENSGAELRLELLRLMAEYEAERPSDEAMRDVVVEAFGDAIFDRPPVLDDVADLDSIDHLSDEDALTIRLYLAATRQYEPPSELFWALLALDINNLRDGEVAKQMLEMAMAAAEQDEVRFNIVMVMSTACFDIDDPDDRARLELMLGPMRSNIEMPLSRAGAVLISGAVATRTGREVDLAAIDAAAAEADADFMAQNLRLTRARRDGPKQLQRYLESLPADQLIGTFMIPEMLPAMRDAGMDVEAELVAEVGRERVRDAMFLSWSTLDGWWAGRVLALCKALGEEGCIDETWRDQMIGAFSANETSLEIRLADAELRGDWKTARDAAAGLVAHNPRVYDSYWQLGRAEASLGNDAAATEALTIFVRFCWDSPHHREAEELLAKLEGNEGS